MAHIDKVSGGLPGMTPLKKKERVKDPASTYIYFLTQRNFLSRNEIYLKNYVNSDFTIALSHIKTQYNRYVAEGSWSEEKFTKVLASIISKFQVMAAGNFMREGRNYDKGMLKLIKLSIDDTPGKPSGMSDPTDDELSDLLSSYYE